MIKLHDELYAYISEEGKAVFTFIREVVVFAGTVNDEGNLHALHEH